MAMVTPSNPTGALTPPAETAHDEAAVSIRTDEMFTTLINLARQSRQIEAIDIDAPTGAIGIPATIPVGIKYGEKPEIFELHSYFERHRTAPERRKGTAHVTTLESLTGLIMRHKDASSVLFAKTDWPDPSITAILDYHTIDHVARFGTHRVHYPFPLTKEFKFWMGVNGTWVEQAVFAALLEEHGAELASPYDAEKTDYEELFRERFGSPNEIIQLSRSLEVYVGQKVKRQERLKSGERTMSFATEHSNSAGEVIDVPGLFMVSVPAFIDGESIRIPARLRYRVSSGDVKWGIQLWRPEYWLRAQVHTDLSNVAIATGLPAYEGTPEA